MVVTKPVLKYNSSSRTVTVSGKKGMYIQAEIEDVRHSISSELHLAKAISNAIDLCNHSLNDAIADLEPDKNDNFATLHNENAPADDMHELEDLKYYGKTIIAPPEDPDGVHEILTRPNSQDDSHSSQNSVSEPTAFADPMNAQE